MTARPPRTYRFGDFELDALKRLLLRRGQPVTLQPKAFDLLLALVEHRGRLVPKDDLLHLVWPDQIVEESNLTVHISALRKALDERRAEHRFIVTEPGRGYRFVADVAEGADEKDAIDRRTAADLVERTDDAAKRNMPAGGLARTGRPRAAALVAGLALLLTAGLLLLNLYRAPSRQTIRITAGPGSQMTLTRLTNGGDVMAAAISPDGKHFAYTTTEPAGQSLWVRQVSGGASIPIAPPEAVEYWGLTFSPGAGLCFGLRAQPRRSRAVRPNPSPPSTGRNSKPSRILATAN